MSFILQLIAYIIVAFLFYQVRIDIAFIYILVIIDLPLAIYSFRFQRTTLSISRMMGISGLQNTANVQMLLTPSYFGALGWVSSILGATVFGLMLSNLGWLFGIMYLLIRVIGISIIDIFTPLPSYTHCFGIIERHLQNEVKNNKSAEIKAASIRLLAELDNARKVHKEGKLKT